MQRARISQILTMTSVWQKSSLIIIILFHEVLTSVTTQESRDLRGIPDDSLPELIWWSEDIFPHDKKEGSTHTLQCGKGQCHTTFDRKRLNASIAQAILFYGTDFRADDLPLPRFPWQHWALFHEESPKNNWILSHEDCISLFNYTATFNPRSDYPVTSHFIRDIQEWAIMPEVTTTNKNKLQFEEGLAPLVYVQRDCNPPSGRDSYVQQLMEYIKVDSYGPCLNNKKLPKEIDGFHKFESDEFYKFLARYKFHLAFENAICDGYMTEKVFRPLTVGSVPVYLGSPSVLDWMPNEQAVILASDFSGPRDLAEFLTDLNDHDEVYNTYLLHKRRDGIHNKVLLKAMENRPWHVLGEWDKINFGHRMYVGFECFVCDKLHDWNNKLRESLTDPDNVDPPTARFANNSHLGCPEPRPAIPMKGEYPQSIPYWKGLYEARALNKMVTAGEVDSKTFVGKYLKMTTDKYKFRRDEL